MKAYFDDVIADGITYSLEHLNPFYLKFFGEKISKEITLKILYSDHCFTARKNKSDSNSERCFNLERYELSKLLPELIEKMNNGSVQVFQTSARRNFAYVVKTTLHDKDYNIFFEVRKRNTSNPDCDLVMRIESAYVFDEGKSLEYTGKIRFLILCQKIYLGEKIQCRK
ncbi:TPA: hypothetical protein ACPOXY_001824 [Haemophilus influenzae]|jgi:hypothetical protein|nr:hypothetical protein [Haemophilus influenzae]